MLAFSHAQLLRVITDKHNGDCQERKKVRLVEYCTFKEKWTNYYVLLR